MRTILVALTLAITAITVPASAAHAKPSTWCSAYKAGVQRCYSMTVLSRSRQIVETVPLENRSSRTATFVCSFSRTITRTQTFSSSVTAEIKKDIPMVAELKFSGTFSHSVSQTASQATAAGGSVTLKPGQKVRCHRTYGSAKFKVHSWKNHRPEHNRDNRYFTVRVPSYMGVLLTD